MAIDWKDPIQVKEYKKKHYYNNRDKRLEHNKEYRHNNKDKIREYKKEYYYNNKDKLNESHKEYYRNNRDKLLNKSSEYRIKNRHEVNKKKNISYWKNRDKILKDLEKKRRDLKVAVISYYSNNTNKCVCCGINEIECLTIDHINGGGCRHLREINTGGGGYRFYKWLIENNYPEGYQILCYNCNSAKGIKQKCPLKHLYIPNILNH